MNESHFTWARNFRFHIYSFFICFFHFYCVLVSFVAAGMKKRKHFRNDISVLFCACGSKTCNFIVRRSNISIVFVDGAPHVFNWMSDCELKPHVYDFFPFLLFLSFSPANALFSVLPAISLSFSYVWSLNSFPSSTIHHILYNLWIEMRTIKTRSREEETEGEKRIWILLCVCMFTNIYRRTTYI